MRSPNLDQTRHGHARRGKLSPEYRSWSGTIQRCENQRVPCYGRYGGRGITVCARWRKSFKAFLSDIGPRPYGASLDRINNTGWPMFCLDIKQEMVRLGVSKSALLKRVPDDGRPHNALDDARWMRDAWRALKEWP